MALQTFSSSLKQLFLPPERRWNILKGVISEDFKKIHHNHVTKVEILVNGLIHMKINMQILSVGLPAGFPELFPKCIVQPIRVIGSTCSCRTT